MGLISAVHLEAWANIIGARYKLGELLRRLIHAGIPLSRINNVHFLANEATQLSGWDGLLECISEVPWIPSGTSVWELGTNTDTRKKIRDDFAIRCNKDLPVGWSKNTTTYVAVTLRKLDDVSALESELQEDSPWYEVKVIDASKLEEWLERFPSVETWLQENAVGPPATIKTLERTWKDWSEVTKPSISTELILTDREKDSQELITFLEPGLIINVQADSPDEAVAFVYATIASQTERIHDHFLATSITVDNQNDLYRLQYSNPQCIILCPPLTEKSQILARARHTVINALGNSSFTQKINIRLNKPLHSNFKKALQNMGVAEENAFVETYACGASPSVWRVWNRLNEGDVCFDIPEWAKASYANDVIPAILLGGFSEQFEGDKEIIQLITGNDYKDYRDKLNAFMSTDNPLLIKVADAYIITAPPTAFALTINNITQSHLEILYRIIHIVFSEIDPTINLAPDERPYAALRTKGMRHSTWLRDGLAGTLLRIVVIGKRLEERNIIPENATCQAYVDYMIKTLPGLSEDWRLIASLRDQLPVLVEAAPVPFLDALEAILRGEPDKILPIFDEGYSFSGHALHPNLLWALETLAWSPEYIARVGLSLSSLAKIDPGGKLSNRPINSLREIFLPWHPSTNANLEQRLQVLDLILDRNPEVGWDILISLMPSAHQLSRHTHEPTWREFGRSDKETLTNGIIRETYNQILSRSIYRAGKSIDRWKQLINVYADLSLFGDLSLYQQTIEDGLKELLHGDINEESKIVIWDTLRELIYQHQGFATASWVLPEERLTRLSKIMDLFAPNDPINKYYWLFNESFPDIPFPKEDINAVKNQINILQKEALIHILDETGYSSLLRLINKVGYPIYIVKPILNLINNIDDIFSLFETTSKGTVNQTTFAQNLSGQAYTYFGDYWTKKILYHAKESNWSIDRIVNAFLDYPDSVETFNLINSLGYEAERLYWESRRRFVYTKDVSSLEIIISKFLWIGRALDIIALPPENLLMLKSNQILDIMDQALKELNEGKKSQTNSSIYYYIEKMLNLLKNRDDVEKFDIAKHEYAFLPLLTRGLEKKDLVLHDLLANNPNLFITIICDLYKPSDEEENNQLSDEQRSRAEFAWYLLQSWRQPPGIEHEGQVNGQRLRAWVNTARNLAAENDRGIVADLHIGHVLYYYPIDPSDSIWPHIELRNLLEDLQSDDIERGIELEQFNSRGVTTKAIFEGGKQERELGKKWHSQAENIDLRWIRTKNMLERIAASWNKYAQSEDQRAEKDRIRYR